jgi:DNA-binding GntR family transcriptional regulator
LDARVDTVSDDFMAERTQAEVAYFELKHRIHNLEIAPNDRIREEFWSQKLNVNRSAVRESLTRLLGEGLVYQGERGGYFVGEMTDEEVHELREVREIIETAALGLACERATSKQLKELEETCDDYANFVKKGYFAAAHEADLRFHRSLVAASGNSRLVQVYERAHMPLFHRKVTRARADLDDFVRTEKEHRAILESVRKKDKKGGVQHLKDHFKQLSNAVMFRPPREV